MDRKLLPRNFFRENPLEELSPARLSRVSMLTLWNDEFREGLLKVIDEQIEPKRKEQMEAEKIKIAQLTGSDEIIKFIRAGYDTFNREVLCKKILTMQPEVMPSLLRRFRTSWQDILIETACYTFAQADPIYIDQLIEMYPDIRSPYAKSMACLVFGVQKREEMLALLLREYERLKKEEPEEQYCQGPLMAIYILYGKA